MDNQALIDRLQTLRKDRSAWDRDDARPDRRTAQVGALTLSVDNIRSLKPLWMVEHERFGVLIAWTPARDAEHATHESCDYARAHILGLHEEQHAE
ncbi:MAG TPA: hypothetical protein PLB89_05390 [Flavobacteriales bacterium]|nr:hypothetical protein [Flavobacteriales bacterium]